MSWTRKIQKIRKVAEEAKDGSGGKVVQSSAKANGEVGPGDAVASSLGDSAEVVCGE